MTGSYRHSLARSPTAMFFFSRGHVRDERRCVIKLYHNEKDSALFSL